ncbi:MAG: hypothetical protein B6226_03210 [Candidatus Cloacimonetes bacterium 4572_65]|nr:MAG: hypothetical protein B6226_03210 [Candidatus Cloacimonetes bacterium 4572_65]
MSHVLKTPMNSILGNSELLYNSELNTDKKEIIKDILISAQDLKGTIDDLIDYSLVSSDDFELNESKTNLSKRIENLFDNFVKSHTADTIKYKLNIASDIPKLVNVDFQVLRQVLNNLLTNAFNFTEEGVVTLDLCCKKRLVKKGKKEYEITFKVTDTGIGISSELVKSIFSFCNQGDASRTKEYQGAGLGLTNSAKIVEKMGASLTVESKEGEGSSFEFTLEFDSENIIDFVELDGNVVPFEDKPKKVILIAEDNDINYKVLTRVIEKITSRYTIKHAKDGVEAVAKFKQFSPALIFMDIHMPFIDGYEATRQIREYETIAGIPNIPILAVSATDVGTGVELSRDAGIDVFIAKPIGIKAIKEALRYIVDD